jgi:hypothetical protein
MKGAQLTIKEVTSAFSEPMALEKAQQQFAALSAGPIDYAKAMETADEVSTKTGVDTKELYGAILKLQDANVAPELLKTTLTNVALAAKDTGEKVGHVADLFAKVKLDEASVPQMREFAKLTGQSKDESLALVNHYESLAKTMPVIKRAQDEITKSAKEMGAEVQKGLDAQIRGIKEAEQASAQRRSEDVKLATLQESLSERIIRAQEASQKPGAKAPQMESTLATYLQGRAGLAPDQIRQINTDLQAGLEQIAKEEPGISNRTLQRYMDTGIIGFDHLMAAAKRFGDAKEAADKAGAKAQITAIEDAKRKNEELLAGLDKAPARDKAAKLGVDQTLLDNFTKVNQQAAIFEKQSSTIAGWWDHTGAAINYAQQRGATLQAMLNIVSLGQLGAVPGSKAAGYQQDLGGKIDATNSKLDELITGFFGGH